MEIKVGEIVENPDGSATLKIDMDQEAMKAMATYGIHQAILNSITEIEVIPEVEVNDKDDKIHYGTKG